ncbi:MAG: class I SAM-dependent RNA methyltransferase [Janthinobacterium lividum]
MNTAHLIKTTLCPHFSQCGGCSSQDLSPEDYTSYKRQKIFDPLNRTLDISQVNIHPLESVHPATRRRVVLKAQRISKGVVLGFYQRQTHHIIDLKTCLIAVPEIEKIVASLRDFLTKLLPLSSKAEIFILKCDQGLDVAIESTALTSLSLEQRELSAEFAEAQKLVRLIAQQEPVYIRQRPTVTFGNCPVDVTPYVFLQASQHSDQWLADKVCSLIPPHTSRIADLFCGRGTLTLPLSQFANVDGYEFDSDALKALNQTAQKYQRTIKTYNRQLFNDPLQASELKPYQLIVINPPRDGAHGQVKQLALSQVSRIVYVSCNPKTFARDAKFLIQSGFKLTDVYPFDQFLWSEHMELVAVFDLLNV